ncbi:MAG: hypothetical protein ACYCYI_08160 [Saccharofermentanales bacterium]
MINFEDPIVITENDILSIDNNGITYSNGFINFIECASNYALFNNIEKSICVGTRDITGSNPCFDFFTNNRITEIFFLPKSKFIEFFNKQNTLQRFHNFNKTIQSFGFTTYDMP